MEAQGLLSGLQWCRVNALTHVTVFGDSAVILQQALMLNVCRASHLRPIIATIRAHGASPASIYLHHVERALNSAADALCNWAMDSESTTLASLVTATEWPCALTYAPPTCPAQISPSPVMTPGVDNHQVYHASLWYLVMTDLRTVSHLVAARFTRPQSPPIADHSRPLRAIPSRVHTAAQLLPSPFDAAPAQGCWVAGRHRHVPLAVFENISRLAGIHRIPFSIDTAFLTPVQDHGIIHPDDIRTLDAFAQHPRFGLAGTLELFRGQTATDYRPNKDLDPTRYRNHLASYPQLQELCSIATMGLIPNWIHTGSRVGPRPSPANYVGAERGATVVNRKLLVDYYIGRCIIASMPTLELDPGFHSSAFALVPKKDAPLTVDGRIIHDLSSPAGSSVNDLTDSSLSPDATWDPPPSIAARVRHLHRQYPGYNVYAMGADIADAFHHVPVHARHASAFGGKLPLSDNGIVSGMAVFGWTASPGFFALFGKASRHYQRTGASIVMGHSEPFWIFQWVDDIVLVEVDIGDRLQQAEKRLRDGVKLVFGPRGWHEGKFTTWSRQFHAVGIDWDIDAETVSIPQRKIDKVKRIISSTMAMRYVSAKRLDSLVGVLRHIITFIPITKPFIQRLTAAQMNCKRRRGSGISMTPFLRKDLEWWQDLTFQNEFSGMPMKLFEPSSAVDDCWLIQHAEGITAITSMLLERRIILEGAGETRREAVARALSRVVEVWGPDLSLQAVWRHVVVHSRSRWITSMVSRMNSDTERGQALLRECGLNQSRTRINFSVHKIAESTGTTKACDVHLRTDPIDTMQTQRGWVASVEQRHCSSEPQSPRAHWDYTLETSVTGKSSATNSDSQYGSTNCPGHNKREWSDFTPACVPQRGTTRTRPATSTRPSTERWQRLSSPTRPFGTRGSTTVIRNLSWSLKATDAPTVRWRGNSQLLHRCCSRCENVWSDQAPKTDSCGDRSCWRSSSSIGAQSFGDPWSTTSQRGPSEHTA